MHTLSLPVLLLLILLLCLLSYCDGERTILIDCGSTGSRIYVYYFNPESPLRTLTEVAHRRIKPGLSSFVGDKHGLTNHIHSLVKFAKRTIPRHLWARTAITLMATAGLRELPLNHQHELITEASSILSTSGFRHVKNETRVISGQEEALYGLLGIMPGFKLNFDDHLFAVADLGGSSQQIAFIYASDESSQSSNDTQLAVQQCTPDFVLKVPGYGRLSILARSLSQMGLVAAMEDVDSWSIQQMFSGAQVGDDNLHTTCGSDDSNRNRMCSICQNTVHKCLSPPPAQFNATANNLNDYDYAILSDPLASFHGHGDFMRCVDDIRHILLPKISSSIDYKCLQSSLPHTIIGLDNFPKVLEMLKLGTDGLPVSPEQIRSRGEVACQTPWEEILADFPGFPSYRAQRACFGSAFIYVILTDLYGIKPRESHVLDPTAVLRSNTPISIGDKVSTGNTIFRAINNVERQELGWAAGAAVYAAMGLHFEAWDPIKASSGFANHSLHAWRLVADGDNDNENGESDPDIAMESKFEGMLAHRSVGSNSLVNEEVLGEVM